MRSIEELLMNSILEFEADSMYDLLFDETDFERKFILNEEVKDEFEVGMLAVFTWKDAPYYWAPLGKTVQLELSTDFEDTITNSLTYMT
jgi:hypothetical protein